MCTSLPCLKKKTKVTQARIELAAPRIQLVRASIAPPPMHERGNDRRKHPLITITITSHELLRVHLQPLVSARLIDEEVGRHEAVLVDQLAYELDARHRRLRVLLVALGDRHESTHEHEHPEAYDDEEKQHKRN